MAIYNLNPHEYHLSHNPQDDLLDTKIREVYQSLFDMIRLSN